MHKPDHTNNTHHPSWALTEEAPSPAAERLAEQIINAIARDLVFQERADVHSALLNATMRLLAGCADEDEELPDVYQSAGDYFLAIAAQFRRTLATP